ncbi:MAG TPA: hypothetical protein VK470_17875 [Bacteroidota bacterium]|nr:hypothetical protein [Bacteroidota bacterium]
MKRNEFIHSACKIGLCTCVGMPLLSSDVLASDNEAKKEDWRIGFMQRRFAKLIDAINSNVTEAEKQKIIEAVGRACGEETNTELAGYVGNIDGMLEQLKRTWIETVEYDKASGTIKLFGKKTGKCGCPFVDKSQISKDFCHCSIGYQKAVWSKISGKEADASIIESVLYGSERCSFKIKIG